MPETEQQVRDRIATIERRMAAFGKKLFRFQREGVVAMASSPSGFGLFDGVGLGKTVQMVCTPAPGTPALVCTLGAVKDTFAREWALWRPECARVVLRKRTDFRWPVPGQVLFMNPELAPPSKRELELLLEAMCERVGRIPDRDLIRGFPKPTPAAVLAGMSPAQRAEHDQKVAIETKTMRAAHEEYVETILKETRACSPEKVQEFLELRNLRARVFARPPYPRTDVFLDEAHKAKNPDAKFTRRWREVARMAVLHGGRAFVATATPMMNKMEEQYEVLQAAGLGMRAFGGQAGYMAASKVPAEFAEKLRTVCIRRLPDDHLDLPPYTVQTIEVELSKEQRAVADEVVRALAAAGVDIQKATLEAIATAMAEKIPREMYSRLRRALATAKLPYLMELAQNYREQGTPFVAACMHKDPLLALEKLGDCVLVTGDQSQAQKVESMRRFQEGEALVCGITTTAAGAGITLHRARIMVVVDEPWNPGMLQQLYGRIRRIGQTASNLLYQRLVAKHELEIRVSNLIMSKLADITKFSDIIADKPEQKEVMS